ncbi:ABC transporter permease [Actinoallomurus iriomotensis]|uniref:ABC transporter n=1 Tax=Actinoallomurus iriomotensis TaxID=478107 RepID=A0A9W6RN23_9ACTN|nr:ABC transporter permease [Actinoallomurus iriomotensis]GLY77012.1 ABC transporter [Actinoallomurus iriomotensis]
MIEALRAEWTKTRTTGGIAWLLTGAIAVTIAVSAGIAAATHVSPQGGQEDPTKIALTGVYLGQAVVAVFAVLTISEEYGTGMIRVSLAAMPRRLVLLAAKAATTTALALTAGILAVTGCLLVGRLMLPTAGLDPAHGYPLISIGHSPTLRAASGSVCYLVLIALLSLGVATALRDGAPSIAVVLGLLYLPPLLAQAFTDPLRRHIEQIAPMTAGLAIQATTDPHSQPIAPWAGLGVLTAWAAASLLIAALLLRLRDA